MSDQKENSPTQETGKAESIEGFPDAEEIISLLGDDFEMPSITRSSEESAPSAEPEPVEDPETGEEYFDEESSNFIRPQTEGEKDKKGRVFDPQLHAVDENGNPRYSKKGLFVFLRKDKRGKVDTDSPKKAEYFETALLYFDGATDTLAGLLGDHWKPANDDQRKSVARSVARYLETEQAPTLTPKQEMLLKIGTYSAPRVTHIDTIDNAKLILTKSFLGIKSFWATVTGKKKPKHEKPAPAPIAEEVTENVPANRPNS